MPSTSPASWTPSRTAIPTIPPWSSAITSWAAVASPRGSPIASARRAGSPTPPCRCSPPIRSIPRRPDDPRDLQPDQRREGRDRRQRGSRSPPPRRRHGRGARGAPRPVTSSSSRSSGADDSRARLDPGRGPLRRPDHGVPGRSRAEDPRAHARGRERRPPQVHRSRSDSRSSPRAISRRSRQWALEFDRTPSRECRGVR